MYENEISKQFSLCVNDKQLVGWEWKPLMPELCIKTTNTSDNWLVEIKFSSRLRKKFVKSMMLSTLSKWTEGCLKAFAQPDTFSCSLFLCRRPAFRSPASVLLSSGCIASVQQRGWIIWNIWRWCSGGECARSSNGRAEMAPDGQTTSQRRENPARRTGAVNQKLNQTHFSISDVLY